MDWLNEQLPSEQFELVPLGLGEANSRPDLDFLLTNQAQFFYLNNQNVRWLATLSNPYANTCHQNKTFQSYG
ncbi:MULTISPECIES: hypothetical protein [unclassified Moraxella]|uniref:hypothetical protein n=1 Tax=unclassified Moraxella TaxID=2685852 RepID=UPI00359EE65C